MQITSAYANKLLKKLQEEKDFLLQKEAKSSTYTASVNEEPVVPDFDFKLNSCMIYSIDIKIATIKHALNISNSTNTFEVDGESMTVDTALIKMAQLNSRKKTLDIMRKRQEKARVNDVYSRNNVPEYVYTNYKVADAEDEFNKCSELITNIQLALDKYNQTVLFDVDIEN